jgi:hypothetical protein
LAEQAKLCHGQPMNLKQFPAVELNNLNEEIIRQWEALLQIKSFFGCSRGIS